MVGTSNLGSWNGHWHQAVPSFVQQAVSTAQETTEKGGKSTGLRCNHPKTTQMMADSMNQIEHHLIRYQDLLYKQNSVTVYPLVNVYIAMENHHFW